MIFIYTQTFYSANGMAPNSSLVHNTGCFLIWHNCSQHDEQSCCKAIVSTSAKPTVHRRIQRMNTYVLLFIYLLTYLFSYVFLYLRIHLCIYSLTYLFSYVFLYSCIYLLMYLLIYVYIYLCTYLYIYLLTYLFTYVLTHLRIYLVLCLFTYVLLMYLFTYVFIYLRIYLCLFTYIFIYLFIYSSIYLLIYSPFYLITGSFIYLLTLIPFQTDPQSSLFLPNAFRITSISQTSSQKYRLTPCTAHDASERVRIKCPNRDMNQLPLHDKTASYPQVPVDTSSILLMYMSLLPKAMTFHDPVLLTSPHIDPRLHFSFIYVDPTVTLTHYSAAICVRSPVGN
jgi:hypothetical protein